MGWVPDEPTITLGGITAHYDQFGEILSANR
jgi:hypothetical protein